MRDANPPAVHVVQFSFKSLFLILGKVRLLEFCLDRLDPLWIGGTNGIALCGEAPGLSLSDELVLGAIENKLDAAGVDPARLTIEVTETAAISNLSAARSFVERLRALGCALALDDFGAGCGRFYYLKYLPFDHLKIDGEFVANCDTDPADQAIIRSIVDIAGELGTEVTAERVQSQEVLETIKKLGVTHAQGYLLGRPAPLDSDASKPGT